MVFRLQGNRLTFATKTGAQALSQRTSLYRVRFRFKSATAKSLEHRTLELGFVLRMNCKLCASSVASFAPAVAQFHSVTACRGDDFFCLVSSVPPLVSECDLAAILVRHTGQDSTRN